MSQRPQVSRHVLLGYTGTADFPGFLGDLSVDLLVEQTKKTEYCTFSEFREIF